MPARHRSPARLVLATLIAAAGLPGTPAHAAGATPPDFPSPYRVVPAFDPIPAAATIVLRVVDLDGDGRDELLALNSHEKRLLLYRPDPGLGLVAERTWVSTGIPRDVAVADIDADGRLDLVVVEDEPGVVVLHRGRGGFDFGEREEYGVAGRPRSPLILDVDNDGAIDILIGNDERHQIALLYPGARESRYPRRSLPVSIVPRILTALHLDADTRLDLIVTDYRSGSRSVQANRGFGFFEQRQTLPGPARATAPFVVDVNGDGRADLVDTDRPPTLGVTLNGGAGLFEGSAELRLAPGIESPTPLDWNRDGRTDWLGTTGCDHRVVLQLATPTGDFDPPLFARTAPCARMVVAADLDGDEFPEVIALSATRGHMAIHFGRELREPAVSEIALAHPVGRVDFDDVDRDGQVDLVAEHSAGSAGPAVSIYLGLGDGELSAEPIPVGEPVQPYSGRRQWADFDGDGFKDLLLWRGEGVADARILWNDRGSFARTTVLAVPGPPLRTLHVADVDHDGRPDLLGTQFDLTYVRVPDPWFPGYTSQPVYSNPGMTTLRNAGGRDFSASVAIPWSGFSKELVTARLHPNLDFVIETKRSGNNTTLTAWPILAPDLLGEPRATTVRGWPAGVRTDDVDGDGLLDFLWDQAGYGRAVFVRGLGDGTFEDRGPLATDLPPAAFQLVDLDADGLRDLGYLDAARDLFRWRPGAAGLTFPTPGQEVVVGPGVTFVTAGDLDGDADTDLVAAVGGSTPRLLVVRNLNRPAPEPPDPPLPARFRVLAPTPNPSRAGGVELRFELPAPGVVHIRVHDASGRLVRDFDPEPRAAGPGSVHWDGRDREGARTAPGVYFARIEAFGGGATIKIVRTR
jgi:hypothetical protein